MNRPPRRHAVAAVSGATLLILGVREALLLRDADLTAARGRARQLGLVRLLAGVLLLARPQLLSGALGLSTAGAPAQWLPRLVAVREVAVDVGALASSGSDADPWPWLITIAAVDGAEAAVLAAALGRRALHPAGGWAFLAADLGSASALLPQLKRLLSR